MKLLSRLFALLVVGCTTGGVIVAWNQVMNRPESGKSSASTAVKHAEVAHPVNETELNTVKLTEDASRRLGVEAQPVQRRSMPRSRAFGAELVLPTGAAVIVSAPLAGTLQDPTGARFPQVGQSIPAGSPVLSLLPMLTPERSVLTPAERVRLAEVKATIAQTQIDAEGQVQQAKVQVEAAQIALKRAERLLSDNVGTRRAVDDAQAQLELAQEALSAAQERKQLVDKITLDEEAGTLEPISITSPLSGIVRTTHVQTGQLISAGMPLFDRVAGALRVSGSPWAWLDPLRSRRLSGTLFSLPYSQLRRWQTRRIELTGHDTRRHLTRRRPDHTPRQPPMAPPAPTKLNPASRFGQTHSRAGQLENSLTGTPKRPAGWRPGDLQFSRPSVTVSHRVPLMITGRSLGSVTNSLSAPALP